MTPIQTEERWFVSDHEWKAANFDYAVACCSTDIIRQDLHNHDHSFQHFDYSCWPVSTFLDAHKAYCTGYGPVFTTQDDILVFADVDQSNPNHEKELRAHIAAAGYLEEAAEQNKAVKEKLVQHMLEKWNGRHSNDPTPPEERESIVRQQFEVFTGLVPANVLGFILTLDSKEEKHEALMLVSGQARLPASAQRPVLLLVSVVDTAQTTIIGESRGYITGYDILANKLIIKPFHSNDDRHFLAEKWSADDLPNDGISFAGTPADFVAKFITFAETIITAVTSPSEAEGFRFLVWGDVAEWVRYHSSSVLPDQEHNTIATVAVSVAKDLRKKFKDVPFPVKEKGPEDEDEKKDDLDLQVKAFAEMVEQREWWLRAAAVNVKEDGKEWKAQEAARMYEKIQGAIKEFELKTMGMTADI